MEFCEQEAITFCELKVRFIAPSSTDLYYIYYTLPSVIKVTHHAVIYLFVSLMIKLS